MKPLSDGRNRATTSTNPNTRVRPVVAGGTVRTDTGQPIRSCDRLNINAGSSPLSATQAPWQAMRALGINTGRVDVKTLQVGLTPAQQESKILAAVDAARNNRCYLQLQNSVQPGTFGDNIANRDAVLAFWQRFAPLLKDEEHVFFELTNEPTMAAGTGVWGHANSWIDPATNAPKPVLTWIRQIYDVMRAAAPDTLILILTSANLAPSAARFKEVVHQFELLGPTIDWQKTAVSYHHYNGTDVCGPTNNNSIDDGLDGIASFAATYPCICTEWNYWMEANKAPLQFVPRKYERDQRSWNVLWGPGTNASPDYASIVYADLRAQGFVIPVE